jgi:ribosomal protein S18 acetylase RimI-like enzyme
VLAGLSIQQRAEMWRRQIVSGAPIVLAEDKGVVQGFAAVGPSEDSAHFAELYAIYVEPSLWGRGIGRDLWRTAEGLIRADGFRETIFMGVEGQPARASLL